MEPRGLDWGSRGGDSGNQEMHPRRRPLDPVRGGEARADSPDSGTSGLECRRWRLRWGAPGVKVGCPEDEGGVPRGEGGVPRG